MKSQVHWNDCAELVACPRPTQVIATIRVHDTDTALGFTYVMLIKYAYKYELRDTWNWWWNGERTVKTFSDNRDRVSDSKNLLLHLQRGVTSQVMYFYHMLKKIRRVWDNYREPDISDPLRFSLCQKEMNAEQGPSLIIGLLVLTSEFYPFLCYYREVATSWIALK